MALKKEATLADRFTLVERLGGGGGGEVWKAHDVQLDRDVALKVLKGISPGSTMVERFRREAALPSRVQHHGITVVYDAGIHLGLNEEGDREERRFIVTELLIGRDLAKVLKDNPGGLATERVIDLGIQLADALAAAHDGKLIHRDLKPSNLFVLAGDSLKICDFGIAGDLSRGAIAERLTVEGVWLGTPYYMSPEQWLSGGPSAGMDLYGMGCILYEMLTGRVPFDGASLDIIRRKHASEAPVPPRDLRPGVPEALNDLTLRLLAKYPGGRPRSARDVAAELRGIRDAMARVAIKAEIDAAVAAAVTEAVARERDAASAAMDDSRRRARADVQAANARAAAAEAELARVIVETRNQAAIARAAAEEAAARARKELADARARMPRLPVRVTAPLAGASLGQGQFEIFILNGPATLRHQQRLGGTWQQQPDIDLPAGQVTAIAAGAYRRGTRVLLAVADGTPSIKEWWQDRGTWRAWEAGWAPLHGDADQVTDAAIASSVQDELDVLTLDAAGRVRHRRQGTARRQPAWSDYGDVGLPLDRTATAIAATSYKRHLLTLVAVLDGGVQVRSRNHEGGWTEWVDLDRDRHRNGGRQVVDIACSSPAPGALDIFALDADGGISQLTWSGRTGTWSDWISAPVPPVRGDGVVAVTAASPGGQRLAVAAISPDGAAGYTAHYAQVTSHADGLPRWSGWTSR